MHGVYSLIQFVDDWNREEGINVGVVLLTEQGVATQFLENAEAHLTARGCRSALGWVAGDLVALDRRLRKLTTYDAETLRHFAACEASALTFTPPRHCKVRDAQEEVYRLFETCVKPRTD